jgi:single-strand DNA-binding protein
MKGINKQILLGRVGKLKSGKVELRETGSGKKVCNFSVATNDYNDEVEWHKIEAWGNDAVFASRFLKQGSWVYIEGRTKDESWTDNDGNEKRGRKVVANPGGVQGIPTGKKQETDSDDDAGF